MAVDSEQVDDLGLPLVRGPFATLDDVRAAIDEAVEAPAPRSDLSSRAVKIAEAPDGRKRPDSRTRAERSTVREPAPIEIRSFRPGDGDRLRSLWEACGMHTLGDDDEGLAALARRSPGLLLVAVQGTAIVASALGAWDGRRGWIYHVATAERHRRGGLARDLVGRIEGRLRELGAPKVNVLVADANDEGTAFWAALGYAPSPARPFGKDLAPRAGRDPAGGRR